MSNTDGDPAIEWNEANAANDDGQAIIDAEREAERLHLDLVAATTRQWAKVLDEARTAVTRAQRLQQQLDNLDLDFSESSLNNAARLNLNDAWRSLDGVMTIADGLLKPFVDSEKEAEIGRLRAEVDQLQRQLAANAGAILAEDAARYHGFVRALDGTLRFCAFAPGHEPDCRDSDGHVIITAVEPDGSAEPIEGEGSDLD